MNFEELQMKRESCRVYADRPVTREQLVHLVDVARFAPSACNSQPWHFILVDEPESREKVVEAFDDNGLTGCPWGASVPAFILICEEKAQYKPGVEEHYGPQHFAQMDIGMAAMGICYEAASHGAGNVHHRHHEPGKAPQGLRDPRGASGAPYHHCGIPGQ